MLHVYLIMLLPRLYCNTNRLLIKRQRNVEMRCVDIADDF